MKTRTIITDFGHDDLVNLFSTATYGSNCFDVVKKNRDYYGTKLEDENDCCEDVWAKILLSGRPVYVLDYYAEENDDAYGNLPHEWDVTRNAMKYTVTLEDIKNGLQKAFDNGGYDAKCALDFSNDDLDFDLIEAEALLQVITFGEVIYG